MPRSHMKVVKLKKTAAKKKSPATKGRVSASKKKSEDGAAPVARTGRNLVIVESPSKAKTLMKFLGKGYTVMASNGHIMDLPTSKLGVDIENDFEPEYV